MAGSGSANCHTTSHCKALANNRYRYGNLYFRCMHQDGPTQVTQGFIMHMIIQADAIIEDITKLTYTKNMK